jgi:hypothetical protein
MHSAVCPATIQACGSRHLVFWGLTGLNDTLNHVLCEKSLVPLARDQYRCVMSIVSKLGLGHLSDGDLTYLISFGINTRHLHLKRSIYCRSKVRWCFL